MCACVCVCVDVSVCMRASGYTWMRIDMHGMQRNVTPHAEIVSHNEMVVEVPHVTSPPRRTWFVRISDGFHGQCARAGGSKS